MIRQGVDHPVECSGCKVFDGTCRFVGGSDHADNLIAFLKFRHDGGDAFQRVLQVGIHANDHVPRSMIDACNHGSLVAKISRKTDYTDILVLLRNHFQNIHTGIGTAIIYKNQLIPPSPVFQILFDGAESFIKLFQNGFFVIN